MRNDVVSSIIWYRRVGEMVAVSVVDSVAIE